MNDVLRFDEFDPPSIGDWQDAALAALKGGALDRLTSATYEGIDIQPIYNAADIEHLPQADSQPGSPPYLRGSTAAGYLKQPWHIVQALHLDDAESFNANLRAELGQGLEAVSITLGQATTLADLQAAFEGVDLTQLPLLMDAGADSPAAAALLFAYAKSVGNQSLNAWIMFDPLATLLQAGSQPPPLDQSNDLLAALTSWAAAEAPATATLTVDTRPYHNAGVSVVQELAYGIASGVAQIRAMQARGLDIDVIASHLRFVFGLGGDFFMEIAKFRAARMLWSQIVAAFGGSVDSQRMWIHAETGQFNKTLGDAHNNLLRTTSEATAALIGGVDSLHILPFNAAYQGHDDFARRIARNQQLMLRHECKLDRLIDPAGGAYYVESLSDSLAQSAWRQFQQIEANGDMVAALRQGTVQAQITETAERRRSNLQQRKEIQVGVNMFASSQDRLPHDAIEIASQETRTRADTPPLLVEDHSPSDTAIFEAAIAAAQEGLSLAQLSQALNSSTESKPEVATLSPQRLSTDFDMLRRAADDYAHQHGHPPQILLAQFGTFQARVAFTLGFFEPAGFDVLDQGSFESVEQVVQTALESAAQAVVISAPDAMYPEIVVPLAQAIKGSKPDTVLILAGYPAEDIETYRAAGIDEFIHLRANCYAVNLALQKRIGVQS